MRGFRFARRAGTGVPSCESMVYANGSTFVAGALVVATGAGAGTIAECAADPTAVTGVALEGADTRAGFGMASNPTQFTGRKSEVLVALADDSNVFSVDGSSDAGVTVATPAQTNILEQYGVAKDANGNWYLDLSEVTTKVVEIADIDTDLKLFFVRFIDTVGNVN